MSPCLADETIAAWAAGALTEAEREHAVEHAASCAVCRAVVGHLMHAPSAPVRLGRYEIRGPLGAGGMGVVLRGHDPALGRDVALKMIKSTLLDHGHRERMLGEAQAMAKVRHPNVVTVHELGEAGDELYVAMELVEGAMLQRWLATPRPRAQRIALVLAIGRGIAAVHAAGLLHRDIKPDNIVVRDDGTPVLVDFGLARASAQPALGAGSGVAGTPRYLAPEVAAGGVATAASDQYQWWTIAGEALPDVRGVARLVARGHDPDPARRYDDMPAAIAALERVVRTRRRWLAIPAVAALAAGAIVVGLVVRDDDAATCDACAPSGWNPARRAAVTTALQRARVDAPRVIAALDARAAATRDARERGCRARDAAERAQWTRRVVCADEAWARVAQLLGHLESTDDAAVREAADELGDVPPVERCVRGSLPAVPEHLPPEQRARYKELVANIQRIERDTAIKPAQRAEQLRALAPEITELKYPAVEARWHWALAHTYNDTRDGVRAAAEFDRAAQAGLAAGDDNLYVRALILELHLTSSTATPERIAQLEAQAQAGARRLASPPVDAELLRGRATLYLDRGDAAKARALFEEADALYTRISVAPMAMHVAVLQNLGAVCLEAGDFDAAERALDRAVERARGRYGEGAPFWEARAARAVVYLGRRDLAKAEAELLAAADGLARTRPDAGQLGQLRAYVCMLKIMRGDLPAARTECAASLAALRATVGDNSPYEIWPLTLAGQVELRAHAYDAAVPFLERAAKLADTGNARAIEAATARAYYAIALLGVRRTREARALATKVAPALRAAELAETRRDFVRAFPHLTAAASP